MTEEPLLFLYITKHSLEGVAASNQIKYQVQGFKESLGNDFGFVYMEKTSPKKFHDEKLTCPIYTKSVLIFGREKSSDASFKKNFFSIVINEKASTS